jgi:uncharacterized protein (DUF488 family)
LQRPILYTIGYEGRSLDDVIALLRDARIDVLLDVREVAWSHKPGFSRKALVDGLPANGIEYIHAVFVGNPKVLRKSGWPLSRILEEYAAHLDRSPDIEARLDAMLREIYAAGRRAALMCFERDPAECHRGVLALRWRERHGAEVVHLGTDQLRLDAL